MAIGTWDDALFRQFRAAKGPRRRLLLERLLIENTPLVKILVDQLCGRGSNTKRGPNRFLGGCQGFREIPWDDAMQCGRMAFLKAAEQFDPAKGKIAGYLKLKIRHELQTFVAYGLRLARVPRGREEHLIPVDLVGEQQELDRLGGSIEDGLIALEGIEPEDVERWQETGEWPETLEEAVQTCAQPEPELPVKPALERFLDEQLVFRTAGRVARAPLWARWERFAIRARAFAPVTLLRTELAARGVRPTTVRVPWSSSPVSGFAGVSLHSAA